MPATTRRMHTVPQGGCKCSVHVVQYVRIDIQCVKCNYASSWDDVALMRHSCGHACHIGSYFSRDLDSQLAQSVVCQVVRGQVLDQESWVCHVGHAGRWCGGGGVVESGRNEELGHQAVEEDLRDLLVAQVARVLIVYFIRCRERHKRVPVARLYLRNGRGVRGQLDAMVAHVLAQIDPILLSDVLRHLGLRNPLGELPTTGTEDSGAEDHGRGCAAS